MRKSGVLMPIFSLPGRYGIGDFSEEGRRFVDFLREAGQSCWQILPIGPTGYGDSPYQSFSTFAGNPYFISPDELKKQGLLTEEDCEELAKDAPEEAVDYGYLYNSRYRILRKAFEVWKQRETPGFPEYLEENSFWIEDYALFMAVKDSFGGAGFSFWDNEIRFRKPEALARYREELADDILFYEFLQYEFTREWFALKEYANSRGVEIIGDIPIYVSPDSADFWASPELFQTDDENLPSRVAGCPPDGFSATGQLWGNPLYDWDYHEQTNYDWWLKRISKCREFYDIIRIDHFRGFDEYYSIPAGEDTAKNGRWVKGPGMKLFRKIKEKLGNIQIIAEDLGYITDSVREMVRESGYPNMKIIEFAFDSRDSSSRDAYYPHNYTKNCVVYTGTHDNETLAGWLGSILPEEREELRTYLHTRSDEDQVLVDGCINLAEASVADLCIIPMQDWLGLDNRARINQPSTLGKNWTWRVAPGDLDEELAARMHRMTTAYGRCGSESDRQ